MQPLDAVSADLSLFAGILFFLAFAVFHLYLHINNTCRHSGTVDRVCTVWLVYMTVHMGMFGL